MTITFRLTLAGVLLATHAVHAEPDDGTLLPPSAVESEPPPIPVVRHAPADPQATTALWGGGVRLTGLSGIGALPGVNYGGEVAVHVRREEYFAELGLSKWRPERTYIVTENPDQHTELGLDVWTVRLGWSSMKMPLRGWVLAEVGEVAGSSGMQGVVSRMVMGDTPQNRQWRAVGAGIGVAWPMGDHVRLLGNLEAAVPLKRENLMIDRLGVYQPDPLVARYSIGMEVGWR